MCGILQINYMHIESHICFSNSRLGHKIRGVLCDGDSNEVVASTVVNCLKIDEGQIFLVHSFFFCVFAANF